MGRRPAFSLIRLHATDRLATPVQAENSETTEEDDG